MPDDGYAIPIIEHEGRHGAFIATEMRTVQWEFFGRTDCGGSLILLRQIAPEGDYVMTTGGRFGIVPKVILDEAITEAFKHMRKLKYGD